MSEYPELLNGYAQAFRRLVVRSNDISIHRPDTAFAGNSLCIIMSNPSEPDLNHLLRLGTFLSVRRTAVQLFAWQSESNDMHVYADSYFAGCKRTMKSTSCGCIMIGNHHSF